MKKSIFVTLLLVIVAPLASFAQKAADSLKVATAMNELLSVCKNVDWGDPKTSSLGFFYKAAPYIVYRGNDVKRKWKAFCNYKKAEDKKGVDDICYKINETVNRDSTYKIVRYSTKKESEGLWHVLFVSYRKKGIEKHAIYAFLKIGNQFGLGDID